MLMMVHKLGGLERISAGHGTICMFFSESI